MVSTCQIDECKEFEHKKNKVLHDLFKDFKPKLENKPYFTHEKSNMDILLEMFPMKPRITKKVTKYGLVDNAYSKCFPHKDSHSR
jgi:hypothetical protein